jgi:hypothetical protein
MSKTLSEIIAMGNHMISVMGSGIMEKVIQKGYQDISVYVNISKVDGRDTVVGARVMSEGPVAPLLEKEVKGLLHPLLDILVVRLNVGVLREDVPLSHGYYYKNHSKEVMIISWLSAKEVAEDVYWLNITVSNTPAGFHQIHDGECLEIVSDN